MKLEYGVAGIKGIKCGFTALILCVMFAGSLSQTAAGQNPIEVDLILDQRLTNAQSLALPTLGIDVRGRGTRLLNLIIENNSDDRQTELYFYIEISASRLGVISRMDQRQGRPFSLRPGQRIMANNNQLQDGLPGVPERGLTFEMDLTPEGEELLNRLQGSTRLPNDVYSVKIQIYQGGNRMNGRLVSNTAIEHVGVAVGGDDHDLALLNPGGPAGSDMTIQSTRPVFRWDGQTGETYRLIVVRDDGQSPEAIIQSALSTEPVLGAPGSGSLLDNEMADVMVRQSSFNYPSSGVQPLQTGERYYWQVFTMIETSAGTELQPSEIWEFSVVRQGDMTEMILEEDVRNFIQQALGGELFRSMEQDGFTLEAMEIDGRLVSGPALIMMLEDLMRRKEAGEINIISR